MVALLFHVFHYIRSIYKSNTASYHHYAASHIRYAYHYRISCVCDLVKTFVATAFSPNCNTTQRSYTCELCVKYVRAGVRKSTITTSSDMMNEPALCEVSSAKMFVSAILNVGHAGLTLTPSLHQAKRQTNRGRCHTNGLTRLVHFGYFFFVHSLDVFSLLYV